MSNKKECPHCGKMIVKLNDHIKRIHPQTPEDIEFKLKENERCLNYARNNRDVLNKCNANWRKNNPEQYKASCKKWTEKNQERMKQYRIDNKEQIFIVSKKNRSQRINCVDCGVEISKGYLSQHKKFCCKDPESIQRKMKEKAITICFYDKDMRLLYRVKKNCFLEHLIRSILTNVAK